MAPETNETMTDRVARLAQSSAFGRFAGFTVTHAQDGNATLSMAFKPELGQYTGILHAGLIAGLLDTAAGFAGVSLDGTMVVASQMSVNFIAPAAGEQFRAEAAIIKAGRRQIFAESRLYAIKTADQRETLIATASVILLRVEGAI